MNLSKNFSVAYEMEQGAYIAKQTDANIKVLPKVVQKSENQWELSLIIENCSGKELFLKHAILWEEASKESLHIGEQPYTVFRSGRHKNDMPGTFTLGVKDERMQDVLGAMTESGDKAEAGEGRKVISDHLTVLQGREKSLVIEWIGGREQLFETIISMDENWDFKKVSAKAVFQIQIAPGQSVESETVRLVWTDNVEAEIEKFAMEKAQRYGSRHGKRPAVFCTWYYYGLTVTYEDVKTNLEIMQKRKLPFDVFQVDEGWEITLGEWKPNEKFPLPMKQLAEEIKQAGYTPGIWTSPFIAHETASVWQEHSEWRLMDKEGKPCLFPMNDTVYHVLDITNPATYQYFCELYHELTFDWGYTYHKLDFTRAAVIYPEADFFDKTVTLAEAYYRAVKAIREGMGEEAYFLMCGGLYDPIIGLVDAQRTGSDVLSMWSSNINKDGKTAPYTIKQSLFRYYMNRWWDNDPDALMIRRNEIMERNLRLTYGLLNEEEVKTAVMNQLIGGGLMCATEPLDRIEEDRLMEYRRILPILPGKVSLINVMEAVRFPNWVDVYLEEQDAHLLCVVNWEDEQEMPIEICVQKLLPEYASKDDKYIICDYYAGEYCADIAPNQKVRFQGIAPHGAKVFKVIKQGDKPVVVKSTGHYSMGAELERMEISSGELRLVGKKLFDYPIQYEVLLPDGSITEGCIGENSECI